MLLVSTTPVLILALSFLITIGITIFMEGLHKHVPKAYIYLPMGFALLVEMLQMRYEYNLRKRAAPGGWPSRVRYLGCGARRSTSA